MKKKLLIFAHRGEAKPFLSHFSSKVVPGIEGLYDCEDHYLLITGEGPWKAGPKLAFVLGKLEVSEVINLGIAGTLREGIQIGSIVQVRNVYLEQNSQMQFASHALNETGLDLITCHNRVLNPKEADHLDAFAPLVDRELWAIAESAKLSSVKVTSYKLISDAARDNEICERVKEKAEAFSNSLLEFYLGLSFNLEPSPSDQHIQEWEGFYFTTSLENKREKLLQSLSIKFGSLEKAVIALELDKIQELEVLPKKKAILLIEKMQNLLSPIQKELNNSLEQLSSDLTRAGAQVKFPKELERAHFSLSAHIENPQDLASLVKAMESFDYLKLIDLVEGRALDV